MMKSHRTPTILPRTAEYAVRATVLLARHYGERLVRADEIASVLGAPRNYLSKTLNALVHSGVLISMRGPAGGFALAKAPEQLSRAARRDHDRGALWKPPLDESPQHRMTP